MTILRWLVPAVSLIASATSAGTVMAEQRCEPWHFETEATEPFRPAQVVGQHGTRAYFHDTGKNCPSDACRRKAYVIPGDRLLISAVKDGWACAFFGGTKGDIVGWVRTEQLTMTATKPPTPESWFGRWRSGRNSFTIQSSAISDSLSVAGIALWGAGPAPRTGRVEGSSPPTGNQLVVKDGTCQVRLTLVDEWLIADDNNECGGLNVTFTGVYRREDRQ